MKDNIKPVITQFHRRHVHALRDHVQRLERRILSHYYITEAEKRVDQKDYEALLELLNFVKDKADRDATAKKARRGDIVS